MSASVNKVFIIGHLGADPELKYTAGGASIAELRIATSETWNDKQGGKQERTEWHTVKVWGKMGEAAAKHLAKGRPVFVEGKITTESWEGKDGAKRYKTVIVAQSVQFLPHNSGGSAGSSYPREAESQQPDPPPPSGGMGDDDIPF